MKKLLLTTLLATQSCAVVPVAGGAFATFRVSQAANHATGGLDCETLTMNAYNRKLNGELSGKIEDGVYTAMFAIPDIVIALATGKPETIGSHGEVTASYIDALPDFCKVNPNGYGGAVYNGGVCAE